MTKKKKSETGEASTTVLSDTTSLPRPPAKSSIPTIRATSPPSVAKTSKSKATEPSTSALIICRNKHWRYISSFHGPWLQLPPEVLESLAYSNYASPRPHPVDPAVFFDLVKIRRMVEEATTLAVRAANGTTSSSLTNSYNASNGRMNGGSAVAFGLGLVGGGANAKLSRERKHRMREQATQKLSHAYHLDEIAASVATMQSASPLEDVAKLVLQRNEDDSDAKYVHFFHEKIPSRSLAQCTSLDSLSEVIRQRPTEAAPYRTRAITRIFKDDFLGAAKDLTDGLGICRIYVDQRRNRTRALDLAFMQEAQNTGSLVRDLRYGPKVEEKDQPSSLEAQLLFQRAGVYLTMACQHIDAALDGLKAVHEVDGSKHDDGADGLTPTEKEARRRRLEARKGLKTNAKRALRDYVSFLSHFDYTPGFPMEVTEKFLRNVKSAANGFAKSRTTHNKRLLDVARHSHLDSIADGDEDNEHDLHTPSHPSIPSTEVHRVSSLFLALPPANIPPYPADSMALVPAKLGNCEPPLTTSDAGQAILARYDCHEAITYHPLLTDALHSLLLCHSLVQTSPKELQRHAHMVARLARVCDGYPIFLAARSPARADWVEILRRTNNWIGLQSSWETLCAPAPLPGDSANAAGKEEEKEEQARERRKHEAIMGALADERVQDEESFQAAVCAREKRAEEQRKEEEEGKGKESKRWAQEEGKEYPISTERAEAVARWVREAPVAVAIDGADPKSKKSGKKGKVGKAPPLEQIGNETGVA